MRKIYLYSGHLDGWYLSERDDLDYTCEIYRDSDCIEMSWAILEFDDIREMIYDLLRFCIKNYTGFSNFKKMIKNIKGMYELFNGKVKWMPENEDKYKECIEDWFSNLVETLNQFVGENNDRLKK